MDAAAGEYVGQRMLDATALPRTQNVTGAPHCQYSWYVIVSVCACGGVCIRMLVFDNFIFQATPPASMPS
jgi:hypothetical protein